MSLVQKFRKEAEALTFLVIFHPWYKSPSERKNRFLFFFPFLSLSAGTHDLAGAAAVAARSRFL